MTDGQHPGLAAYRAALRLPGAARFSSAGALARLPQAMVGLGSVLLLTGLHRSYTLAGLVAGAISLAQCVTSPWISRLIDRRGQFRVLAPQLLAHLVSLALLVTAGQRHAPAWLLLATGALVGVSMPQFGASSRARWTALLGDRPRMPHDPRMHTALSVESLIDEAVFIVGPVLVTTLATALAPAAGLITATGLAGIGGALFLGQRSTEPPAQVATRQEAPKERAINHPGLRVIVGVFVALGVLFGLVEVGTIALTREHHHPGAAGTMLALWATGSLICGTAYGAMDWRTPAVRRFQIGTGAVAAGCALIAAASHSLLTAAVALTVAGMANAPTLITGHTLVPSVVPARSATEAYTWLGVAVFAGIAVGSPVGGALIDHAGAGAALWASVIAGAVAATIAAAGQRALAARAGAP